MKTIIILLATLVVIAAAIPEPADLASEFSQLTQGLLLISILCLKLKTVRNSSEDYFIKKNAASSITSVE